LTEHTRRKEKGERVIAKKKREFSSLVYGLAEQRENFSIFLFGRG